MARQARQSEPRSARLCRRDRGRDQHGAPLRPQSVRPAPGWADPPWPLEGDHVRRRPHRPRLRRPLRARRPDERRHLQGLDRADARPGAAAGRHRDHGQSRKSPASARRSRRAAPSCAFCRPTRPTSIRSSRPSPSSRHSCARPPSAPSTACGTPSASCSTASPRPNAPTTSSMPVIHGQHENALD